MPKRKRKPKPKPTRQTVYIYRPEHMPARERFGWLRVRDDTGEPWRVTGWGRHPFEGANAEE